MHRQDLGNTQNQGVNLRPADSEKTCFQTGLTGVFAAFFLLSAITFFVLLEKFSK